MTPAVEVYVGDICTAPAEVVCSSTNPHLDLMLGTGGAIREAGGWDIQHECSALIAARDKAERKRWLPPGSAVRTGAGKLPFRAVIHCIATDAFHGSSPEIISSCVRQALARAAELDPPAGSIAFPVLATGHGNYPFEPALAAMLGEIQRAAPASLQRVVIVLRDAERRADAARIIQEHRSTP